MVDLDWGRPWVEETSVGSDCSLERSPPNTRLKPFADLKENALEEERERTDGAALFVERSFGFGSEGERGE